MPRRLPMQPNIWILTRDELYLAMLKQRQTIALICAQTQPWARIFRATRFREGQVLQPTPLGSASLRTGVNLLPVQSCKLFFQGGDCPGVDRSGILPSLALGSRLSGSLSQLTGYSCNITPMSLCNTTYPPAV